MPSYRNVDELPVPFAAIDPLDSELLFGDSKPDELRTRRNEAPTKDKKGFEVEASVTRAALDRMAKEVEAELPQHSRNLRRYIARLKAAEALGMSSEELHSMFYGGKKMVDPIRLSALGYEPEARFIDEPAASVDQPEVDQSKEEELEGELDADVPKEEGGSDELPAQPDDDPAAKEEPDAEASEDEPEEPAEKEAVFQGKDVSRYDWLNELTAEVIDPSAQPTTDPQTGLKQGDQVNMGGESGQVTQVDPDGKAKAQFSSGSLPEVTFDQQAVDNGTIKRSTKTAAVTPTADQVHIAGSEIEFYGSEIMAHAKLENDGQSKMSAQQIMHLVKEVQDVCEEMGGWFPQEKQANMGGIQPAPDGMQTNPETGVLEPSDVLKGKEQPKTDEKIAVILTFPNLERRVYSTRPFFLHNWTHDVKTALLREGGTLQGGDQLHSLNARFRMRTAAVRFAHRLVNEFYVPQKFLSLMQEKQAAPRQRGDLGPRRTWDNPEGPVDVTLSEFLQQHPEFNEKLDVARSAKPGKKLPFEEYLNGQSADQKRTPHEWADSLQSMVRRHVDKPREKAVGLQQGRQLAEKIVNGIVNGWDKSKGKLTLNKVKFEIREQMSDIPSSSWGYVYDGVLSYLQELVSSGKLASKNSTNPSDYLADLMQPKTAADDQNNPLDKPAPPIDRGADSRWSRQQKMQQDPTPITYEQSQVAVNGKIENKSQKEFSDAMGDKKLPYNDWPQVWMEYWTEKQQKEDEQSGSTQVSEALQKVIDDAVFVGHESGQRGGGGGGDPEGLDKYPKTAEAFHRLWNETAGLDPDDPDEDGLSASEGIYDEAAGWLLVGKGELPEGDLDLALEAAIPIVYFHTPPEKTADGWVIAGVSGV